MAEIKKWVCPLCNKKNETAINPMTGPYIFFPCEHCKQLSTDREIDLIRATHIPSKKRR
jgi:hypothetical protein